MQSAFNSLKSALLLLDVLMKLIKTYFNGDLTFSALILPVEGFKKHPLK